MPRRENLKENPEWSETINVKDVKYKNYIGIKVDPRLKEILRDIAGDMGITVSELIRKAITLYLWNIITVLPNEKKKKVIEVTAGDSE